MIICKKCGNANEDTATFCSSCNSYLAWTGEKIEETPPVPEPPNVFPDPPPVNEKHGVVEKLREIVRGEGGQPPEEEVGEPEPAPPNPTNELRTESPEDQIDSSPVEVIPERNPVSESVPTPFQPSVVPVVPEIVVAAKSQGPGPVPPDDEARTRPPVLPPQPEEDVGPDAIECPVCGRRNRKNAGFCKYCGATLKTSAPVVARVSWWRRIFRRKKRVAVAGERHGPSLAKQAAGAVASAKRSGGTIRRKLPVGRIIAVAVLAGIGVDLAVPSIRRPVFSGVGSIRRMILPHYTDVNPSAAKASSAKRDHPASSAVDGVIETYWSEGARGAGQGQTITVTFAGSVDLSRIGFILGASALPQEFRMQPRPHVVKLTFSNGSTTKLTLKDSTKPQWHTIKAGKVTSVRIEILSVYASIKGSDASIAEIEFRTTT